MDSYKSGPLLNEAGHKSITRLEKLIGSGSQVSAIFSDENRRDRFGLFRGRFVPAEVHVAVHTSCPLLAQLLLEPSAG